jgi:sulfate-transporting ATPase
LLDEPAAGLSDAETAELGRLLQRLARRWGIGILLIEHEMALVMENCDRVVVLEFGKKIAEGAPEDVRREPSVVAAYLGGDDGELVTAPEDTTII